MATIDHLESVEDLRAFCEGLDASHLVAQQLVQRGALDALENLLAHGVTEQTVHEMKDSLVAGLMTIQEVALERGITLIDYS